MEKQYKNYNRNHDRKTSPIDELLSEVRKAKTLKEVFVPERYALPGGWAYLTAELLKKDAMNTNQLRKIFTQLKNIEGKIDNARSEKLLPEQINEILLVMPQIAYARGRDLIPYDFYNLMKECISQYKIKDKEDYKSFISFYTAVVAYSKL